MNHFFLSVPGDKIINQNYLINSLDNNRSRTPGFDELMLLINTKGYHYLFLWIFLTDCDVFFIKSK